VLEPELAQPALAVLVARRGHPDHGEPGGGEPGQRVTVQPTGAGGDDRRLGLAGGGHGEQVAQVIAAMHHLGRSLSSLAGLHQRGLPCRPDPGRDQPDLHVATPVSTRPAAQRPRGAQPVAARATDPTAGSVRTCAATRATQATCAGHGCPGCGACRSAAARPGSAPGWVGPGWVSPCSP
jgi:hypothetical protein